MNPIKNINTTTNNAVTDECMSLSIAKNGKFFVTGGSEKKVKVWDV